MGDQADQLIQEVQQTEAEEAQVEAETDEALAAAMMRMEEANLWKILIKQDVFEQGSARPEILTAANKKLKKFALTQLNQLLNIGQQEQEKKQEFPLSREEIFALKVLASRLLKTETPSVPVPTDTERVPSVRTVAAPEPSVRTVSAAEPSVRKVAPAQPQQRQAPPKQPGRVAPKVPGRTPKKGADAGYALPKNRRPMPTADQLIGTMQQPKVAVTAENISQRDMNVVNPQDLVSNLVQQLTGGNVVANDTSTTDADDVNSRM